MNVTKDTDFDKWEKYTNNKGCLKIQTSAQKQHFTICCDEGAEEHGIRQWSDRPLFLQLFRRFHVPASKQ